MAYNKLAIFEKPIFYTRATKNEVISEKLANSKSSLQNSKISEIC